MTIIDIICIYEYIHIYIYMYIYIYTYIYTHVLFVTHGLGIPARTSPDKFNGNTTCANSENNAISC